MSCNSCNSCDSCLRCQTCDDCVSCETCDSCEGCQLNQKATFNQWPTFKADDLMITKTQYFNIIEHLNNFYYKHKNIRPIKEKNDIIVREKSDIKDYITSDLYNSIREALFPNANNQYGYTETRGGFSNSAISDKNNPNNEPIKVKGGPDGTIISYQLFNELQTATNTLHYNCDECQECQSCNKCLNCNSCQSSCNNCQSGNTGCCHEPDPPTNT